MRFGVFIFLLAAIAPALSANAGQVINQPRPPGDLFVTPQQVFDVRSGAEQGPLQVRYFARRSGYANGTIFGGDRVAGFHYVPPAGQQETLALVRYRGATPIQVIAAGPSGGGWSGLAVAIDAAAGATQQQNMVGFRAAPTNCVIGSPSCVRGGIPITPRAQTPFAWSDPIAGLAMNANGVAGILVVRSDAAPPLPGAFAGHVLGERTLGHYGAGAGTIGFVRYDASGVAYQAWVGVLGQTGMSGGSGYPLAPHGAESFTWTGQMRPQGMVSIRSTTGNSRCLSQGPVLGGACIREWLLVPNGAVSNGRTGFLFVNRGNGLCLDFVPGGGLVREAPCVGGIPGLAQQFTMGNFAADRNGDLRFLNAVNTLDDFNASQNLLVASLGECLLVRASDIALVSGDCSSGRAIWTQVP